VTEAIFALVPVYGLWVVAASAYLSCLALPIPTFAVMLAAGAFAAAGDLVLWQVLAVAWGAAVAGDQTGFRLGRRGGSALTARLGARPDRAALMSRARAAVDRWGSWAVFFSTWAVAPLGPWVNLIAGATGFGAVRFLLWDALGEAIWVGGYVGLGYAFGSELDRLVEIVGNWGGLISAAAITLILGAALIRAARRGR
jgi:membrane protein DedA with SNARE-associated domain